MFLNDIALQLLQCKTIISNKQSFEMITILNIANKVKLYAMYVVLDQMSYEVPKLY